MKRWIIISILIFSLYGVLSASDNENNNWTFNLSPASINLLDFNDELLTPAQSTSIASTMVSLSFGLGYHLNVIPNILSPGLYIDLGIGYLSFIVGMFSGSDNEDDVNSFGGWAGIRLYNRFKYNLFDIDPFIGLTLYGFSDIGLPVTTFGILLAYKYYGVEYSFHLPLINTDKIYYIHRISFIYHFY